MVSATDWLWFVYATLPGAALLDLIFLSLGLWVAKVLRQRRRRSS